jgi:hypothetical protein
MPTAPKRGRRRGFMRVESYSGRLFLALLGFALGGCAGPVMTKDGQVVVQQQGAHGAGVMTANGVEYHDRKDLPQRIVVRSPNDPWRAPVGFILPSSGRFVVTSRPTLLGTPGMTFAMRPSDTRVPSWGGEVFVRVDLLAPAAPGEARPEERVAIVVDGAGSDTVPMLDAALAQLGGHDHVTIVDVHGAHVVVPTMPASHRSLASAALARRLESRPEPPDLAGALARATSAIGTEGPRLVVLLTDGASGKDLAGPAQAALAAMSPRGIPSIVVATSAHSDFEALNALSGEASSILVADEALEARARTLRGAIPAPGPLEFTNVVLSFEGTPAPSHVLEASGGDVRWKLESGELALGDVYAGEMRTEIVRVTIPPWVPGEKFAFTVTARFGEAGHGDERNAFSAKLPCVYDDDIERIANSRHGDVISYASALATMRRLDAAFVGPGVEGAGGLRKLAEMHARSMSLLARDMHDPQIMEQAEILTALLAATP